MDLFAGAGGLSLGLEQAGFDVVVAVEHDPIHAVVHRYNFPQTEVLCCDVRMLGARELRAAIRQGLKNHGRDPASWDGWLDVMVGGPPCQGFSTMGHRVVSDDRNDLVLHFARLVRELQPRYVAMENVPGMAAGNHYKILRSVIRRFKRAGYRFVEPFRLLNAADFGVPQDRKRLFILGSLKGETPVQYPQAIVRPVSKRFAGAKSRRTEGKKSVAAALPIGPSVFDAIGDLPNVDDLPELIDADELTLSVVALQELDSVASSYARAMRHPERDASNFGRPRMWDRDVLTNVGRTFHTEKSVARFRATKPGSVEQISRFYRIDGRGLSNTLRAGTANDRGGFTSARPIHPKHARVLTVREAARLHSFPDWFRFHKTKWHGFREIGNAVPPLLGQAVGYSIARALGLRLRRVKRPLSLGDPGLLAMHPTAAAAEF